MYYYRKKRLWTCERCKKKVEFLGYNSLLKMHVCGKCDSELNEESVF